LGKLNFDAHFWPTRMQAEWNASFVDVSYSISSQHKQVEEVLTRLFDPVPSFEISGEVSGPFDAIQLRASSALGRSLAAGLQSEFQNQLLAIDENLRREILDLVDSPKADMLSRLRDADKQILLPLQATFKEIQDLLENSDQNNKRS
jgi:hypothetical protein